MLGLALLLGIAPPGDLAPEAARPGDLAPHLTWRTGHQWALSSRPAWHAFQATWGAEHAVRWDERTGAPRFVWVAGLPLAQADAFAADLAALAGVPADQLRRQPATKRGARTFQRYARSWRGAEVLGDEVLLVAEGGRISAAWVRLSPVALADTPAPGEVVLPVPRFAGAPWSTDSVAVRAALVTPVEAGPLVRYTDRSGAVVHTRDQRHFAQVDVEHYARTVGDPLVTDPARGVFVEDAAGATDLTATDGSHGLSGSLTVSLTGPDLHLSRDRVRVDVTGTDDVVLEGGANVSQATAVVLHHFYTVWGWLEDRWPEHAWLGQQVQADVDRSDSICNAWYTGGTLTFLRGDPAYCHNFGQIRDVLFHEVGHGIHHYILQGGTFAGDVSEGSADYVSATLNDDPVLAPNALPGGGHIRELESDRRYPEDRIGQVHNDGLIWGSFLWNLREAWQDDLGDGPGAEATDRLFLGALEQGPALTDLYEAVIVADDDDGDLTNGTPHACELVDLLDQHGLGPGPIGVVQLSHAPLGPQSSTAPRYPLDFTVAAPTAACADLDADSIRLWWTTDPTHTPGLEGFADARPPGFEPTFFDTGGGADSGDTGGAEPIDPYAAWQSVELSRTGWTWAGAIPRQPATTTVTYFIEAASSDGSQVVRSHAGSRGLLHRFDVGDTEALWCEGFEDGAPDWTSGAGLPWEEPEDRFTDEWVLGAPVAGPFSPDAAPEGAAIAATAPGESYRSDNRQHLQSPALTLDGPRPLLRFGFQRWLTVEDGVYDHARLWGGPDGSDLWWENPPAGGAEHVMDQAWGLQSWPLEVPEEGATFQWTWTLESDQGLEFGGWHLDAVCVTALDDVPAHYRRASLQASEDAAVVTVSWEQPWIAPLDAVVVMKRSDAWPTGPDDPDAEALASFEAATPGAAHSLEDDTLAPGERAFYALFASDGERWFVELVEGENAAEGGTPAPEPEDTGDGSSADDGADDEPGVDAPAAAPATAPGCGCAAGGGAGGEAVLLALLPALARRRR